MIWEYHFRVATYEDCRRPSAPTGIQTHGPRGTSAPEATVQHSGHHSAALCHILLGSGQDFPSHYKDSLTRFWMSLKLFNWSSKNTKKVNRLHDYFFKYLIRQLAKHFSVIRRECTLYTHSRYRHEIFPFSFPESTFHFFVICIICAIG